jgi:hypothetical protein
MRANNQLERTAPGQMERRRSTGCYADESVPDREANS